LIHAELIREGFQRNFGFASILGFGCTLIATWEVILTYVLAWASFSLQKCFFFANMDYSLLTTGLTDGGTAGLIWGFVIICIGFLLVFASLAEMASM